MKTSESIQTIMPALLEAQKAIDNVHATKSNEFGEYKYADLADVLKVVKKPLNDNNILIIHGITANGELKVATRLQHTSGEYIETEIAVPPVQNKKSNPVQAMGAAITYARRYALTALCGIASDEDNDAEGLVDSKPTPPAPPRATQPPKREGEPLLRPMKMEVVGLIAKHQNSLTKAQIDHIMAQVNRDDVSDERLIEIRDVFIPKMIKGNEIIKLMEDNETALFPEFISRTKKQIKDAPLRELDEIKRGVETMINSTSQAGTENNQAESNGGNAGSETKPKDEELF